MMERHPTCRDGCRTGRTICARGVCVLAVGTAPEPEPPTLLRQAANFAGSLARHVAGGCKTVGPELKAARLAVCSTCDQFDDGRCLACGCHLRAKAAWALEECPRDKWPPAEQ